MAGKGQDVLRGLGGNIQEVARMKLVDNAGRWWRWLSMQAMGAAVALQGAWVFIPDDLKARAGDDLANWVTVALLVLGMIGRMVKQRGSA